MRDICAEGLISRATFYLHYADKYDLLKDWLVQSKFRIIKDAAYEQIEEEINEYVHMNQSVIKNLLYNADDETLETVYDFILSILNISIEKDDNGQLHPKRVVLSNIYAGGIIHYIVWQIKNNFPSDVAPMNIYLYEVISKI